MRPEYLTHETGRLRACLDCEEVRCDRDDGLREALNEAIRRLAAYERAQREGRPVMPSGGGEL